MEQAMMPLSPRVRFPAMREELRYAVAALGDERYQDSVWRDHELPQRGYAYDFDMACHAVLDDTSLVANPEQMIGDVLLDADELEVLLQLTKALLAVITEIGPTGTFQNARRSAAWSKVVATAYSACAVMGRPSAFP